MIVKIEIPNMLFRQKMKYRICYIEIPDLL